MKCYLIKNGRNDGKCHFYFSDTLKKQLMIWVLRCYSCYHSSVQGVVKFFIHYMYGWKSLVTSVIQWRKSSMQWCTSVNIEWSCNLMPIGTKEFLVLVLKPCKSPYC
ncbi:hypothetical protein R6Q59_008824 [Mikania micrantha]